MELKNFFEVFTQFENNTEVKDIFRDVMVKRIVNNRSRNIIRIYIECNRLIHKDDIYKVENELVKIFRGKVQVKIIESFNLLYSSIVALVFAITESISTACCSKNSAILFCS